MRRLFSSNLLRLGEENVRLRKTLAEEFGGKFGNDLLVFLAFA